ncbi:MAG: toll/interleukin-1 receptor domain-containing protein [Bacteroidetes bacterium]|nr:toll/interleukin-1 receptor domain-containing protein [Bacteroidota bacterium]
MAPKKSSRTPAQSSTNDDTKAGSHSTPPVFISHDTRDADIAEAFSNLLQDASGGVLRSFRSSDRKGTAGIEFGAEWYSAIMDKLKDATDVVALLTSNSIGRPWILYEAGVAKGRLDSIVFGVAIGVPLEKASVGPFAQFQNCGDDEDSLTKLVLQLIRRNPDANPREEAVRRQVAAFLESTASLFEQRAKENDEVSSTEIDASAVAKLFEEVKVMFRQLPEQIRTPFNNRHKKDSLFIRHDVIYEELFFNLERSPSNDEGIAWLTFASVLREDLPWIYELAMEIYRAFQQRDKERVSRAKWNLLHFLRSKRHHFLMDAFSRYDDGRRRSGLMRHLPELLEHMLEENELGYRDHATTKSDASASQDANQSEEERGLGNEET